MRNSLPTDYKSAGAARMILNRLPGSRISGIAVPPRNDNGFNTRSSFEEIFFLTTSSSMGFPLALPMPVSAMPGVFSLFY
jgi:hypothetical protein